MYLWTGFSAAVSVDVSVEQSIDTLGELDFLDNKEIQNICTVIQKQGGTIPNPSRTIGKLRWY